MTDHRPVPDIPFRPLVRGSLIATLTALLGGWLLTGCASSDWSLSDPDWTPPAESREVAATLSETAALSPDLSLRGRLSEGCELNYAAYPDVFGLNVESLVAELGDGPIPWAEIKRRATPALQEPADGCSGHSPDHRAAVAIAGGCAVCDETDGQRVPRWLEELMWYDTCDSGSRAWLARSRVLRRYNSCTGVRQTVCPSLPLTPPDCERWRAALDDSRGQYYHCADPEVHAAKDILCATSDPCPGWSRDWPPPGGEESCTHWVPRDIQCGYSASPFVSGAVCNERRKSGEEPPPPPGPVCGDGTCDHDETQASCPVDCGTAPPPPPPPPPPPSGDCDLSPVVQRQDALIAELERLREALADRPAPICPEPVCHPAPCRLDCDCPAPCPDVICGDGEPEPPDPTDPPPPTGETLDVVHHYPGYRQWTLPPGRYRTTITAESGPDAPHWQENAQIVVLVVRAEHRWELQYRVAKDRWVWITNHQARELPEVHAVETVTGVLINAPDGLIVEVGIPPEVEAKIGPKWAHWGPGEGWRATLHFSPASEARSFALWPGRDGEPMTLPEKLQPVRWGEGVEP